MNSTEKAFSERLDSLGLADKRVLVAFSGGCDSLALLILCTKILGTENVRAVYINHNLRHQDELEAEIALNRANCEKLGIELEVQTIERGLIESLAGKRHKGVEEAARFVRYEKLGQRRKALGCDAILTAHHLDDQIETLFMRSLRKAPVWRMRGILDIKEDVARPLLSFRRTELEDFVRSEGFLWSTDSTNSDNLFERNRIRNSLIPEALKTDPLFYTRLLSQREQANVFSEKFDNLLSDTLGGKDIPNPVSMEIMDVFDRSGDGFLEYAVYRLWDSVFSDRELPSSFSGRVAEAVRQKKDTCISSNLASFSVYRGKLYLVDLSSESLFSSFVAGFDPKADNDIELADRRHFRTAGKATASDRPEKDLHIDAACFSGSTCIRYARPGDRIKLKGGQKSVFRLLQDMKVPAALRTRVPVVEDSDGICIVFGTSVDGKDRISMKMRTSLAPNLFPLYIVS